MTDWTAGYIADIGYTFGYYPELNPLRLQLAFLNAALVLPSSGNACELGFGQGISTNVHAVASTTSWSGTDFNPAQAGFAQEVAAISGANAQLFDQSFADYCSRSDLPDFDYIGLHGIWSWISDENRSIVVDFVRRKLKVGGVLYISYNTQPGWASMVPMRDLLMQHGDVMAASGQGMVSRIDGALDFAERLFDTSPVFAQAHPHIATRLTEIKHQSRNYVAHEYFNRDWLPMSFAKMADWLAPAKLDYGCSANYFDHIDALNITVKQKNFLNSIADITFRETVRDFMLNRQFRKDYWVKGARKLNHLEQGEALRSLRVMLVQPRHDVTLKVTGALGDATLNDAVHGVILDVLSDYQPQSLEQIALAVKADDIVFSQVLQAVLILAGAGTLAAVQDDDVIAAARKKSAQLNQFLYNKARGSGDIAYLASPVTGGGIRVERFSQLFLLARSLNKTLPSEWARLLWQILQGDGEQLHDEATLADLTRQAQHFSDQHLPVLTALGIA